MKKLIFTALLIVLQPVLIGCSNSSSEWIRGTWRFSDPDDNSNFNDSLIVQFNPDGTFVFDWDEDVKGFIKFDDVYGTYTIEDDQLTLVLDPVEDDNTETLTIIDKEANSFRIVDSNEDYKSRGEDKTDYLLKRIE